MNQQAVALQGEAPSAMVRVMRALPRIITHNYHPRRGALRNICDLCDSEAERVLDGIRASGAARLRPTYLRKRRATEAWLIDQRTRKLGPPPLARPLYFFLGDFADGQDPSRPRSLVVPLAAFTPDMLTFTFSDSMASFSLGRGPKPKPHHGCVFTMAEIADLVAEQGIPDPHGPDRTDRFIEVQVWDARPLSRFSPTEGTSLP